MRALEIKEYSLKMAKRAHSIWERLQPVCTEAAAHFDDGYDSVQAQTRSDLLGELAQEFLEIRDQTQRVFEFDAGKSALRLTTAQIRLSELIDEKE